MGDHPTQSRSDTYPPPPSRNESCRGGVGETEPLRWPNDSGGDTDGLFGECLVERGVACGERGGEQSGVRLGGVPGGVSLGGVPGGVSDVIFTPPGTAPKPSPGDDGEGLLGADGLGSGGAA